MKRAALIFLLLSLLPPVGCAPSVPHGSKKQSPPLSAKRFVSSGRQRSGRAEGWTGRYEGAGSVYTREGGDWRRDEPLRLILRADRPDFLFIEGIPLSDSGWAFGFGAKVGDSGVLAGERISDDGRVRYEYSFAREGDRLTGVLKRYRTGPEGLSLRSPDEWVFEARRKP